MAFYENTIIAKQDLAEKEIGETIRISAIKLPEGVIPTIKDRDFYRTNILFEIETHGDG